MATAPSTAAMNGDDHWFYSVSPQEKEARKLEVTCNLTAIGCISIISYRVSHKSVFTLFLLFSRVLEQVQRNF